MIAVIDYGAGNLASVLRGLRRAGLSPEIATAPSDLTRSTGILVPGVGHFDATRAITSEWRSALRARVDAGTPLLGICLGMQWLFEGSEEAPGIAGIGLLPGVCRRLPSADGIKVPHLGWNTVHGTRPSRILGTVVNGAFAYFAHTYAAPVGPDTVATTTHGTTFASVVERGRVFGAQCHPELSSATGAAIFAAFAEATRC